MRTPRVKPELFTNRLFLQSNTGGRADVSPDGVQGRSPCEGDVSPDGVQGQSPAKGTCPPMGCRGKAPASIHTKTSFNRRARRAGGAAAAPAGRGLPKEARAARSLGKAKAGEDAARQARTFYKLTVFAIQYGGRGTCPPTGCRGGAPAKQQCL